MAILVSLLSSVPVILIAAALPAVPAAIPADIDGAWVAQVRYDWGDSHLENFELSYDGAEVLGTASYLGRNRAVFDGQLTGDRISFITRSQQTISSEDAIRDGVHHYVGQVKGDQMQFTLRSEGGFTEHVPVKFTAVRNQ